MPKSHSQSFYVHMTNVAGLASNIKKFNRPFLASFFFLFVIGQYMFNINFANNWIQTVDLWNRKQPLNQLSHNQYHKEIYLFKNI